MKPISSKRYWLLGGVALLLVLALWLGCRLRWSDAHASWQRFPRLADSALVAEEISKAQLWHRYHYRLPVIDGDSTPSDFTAVYRANLQSVRSLGYRSTSTRLDQRWWSSWRTYLNGRQERSFYNAPEYLPKGYEYFELRLGDEVAHWKETLYDPEDTNLADYYQFNYPTTAQDTLFLSFRGTCWLVHRPRPQPGGAGLAGTGPAGRARARTP